VIICVGLLVQLFKSTSSLHLFQILYLKLTHFRL